MTCKTTPPKSAILVPLSRRPCQPVWEGSAHPLPWHPGSFLPCVFLWHTGQQEYSPSAHLSTAACLGRDVWHPGTSRCWKAKRSVGAQLTVSNLIHSLCMNASRQRSILALVVGASQNTELMAYWCLKMLLGTESECRCLAPVSLPES